MKLMQVILVVPLVRGTRAFSATECAFRALTYDYALKQSPDRAPLLEVFDALELATACDTPRPAEHGTPWPSFANPPSGGRAWYVATDGSDSGAGTVSAPFKTVAAAVAASRERGMTAQQRWVLLRSGIHYLTDTVALDALDSNLTIQNYNGEEAWLSGGVRLSPTWSRLSRTQPAGSCASQCKAAGHCCEGTTSSYQHPSCSMGCSLGSASSSVAECTASCRAGDGKCRFNHSGVSYNNCGSCTKVPP